MEEPPITNNDGIKLKGGLNSFIFRMSIRMSYYKREHNKLVKVCNQVLNLIHIHPHLLSQDNHLFTVFTFVIWPGVAVLHLKRGTAAERHYCSWATVLPRHNWPLGWGVFIPLTLPSNGSSSTSTLQTDAQLLIYCSLSSPLVTLSSQAFLCDFSINPWEKRLQNSIREQIHWFPNSKSTWFPF